MRYWIPAVVCLITGCISVIHMVAHIIFKHPGDAISYAILTICSFLACIKCILMWNNADDAKATQDTSDEDDKDLDVLNTL